MFSNSIEKMRNKLSAMAGTAIPWLTAVYKIVLSLRSVSKLARVRSIITSILRNFWNGITMPTSNIYDYPQTRSEDSSTFKGIISYLCDCFVCFINEFVHHFLRSPIKTHTVENGFRSSSRSIQDILRNG